MPNKNSTRPGRRSARGSSARTPAPRESYRHGNLPETLVAEAIRLMNERADASFTLREVAQRIGVSHSAAYRHFPSKGSLLAEIARQGFEMLTAALAESFARERTPESIIRFQARAYVRTALKHPAHFRCMFGPRQFDGGDAAPVDAAGDRAFECLTEASRRLLGIEIAAAATHRVTLALWSIVHGLAYLALDEQLCDLVEDGTIVQYEALAESAASVVLEGVATKPARR